MTRARRDPRRFGFTVGTAFVLLGGFLLWRGHNPPAYGSGVVGTVLVAMALLGAPGLATIERGWMRVAVAISKVTTPILMTLVYMFVLTPIGLLRRALGQTPTGRSASSTSFWVSVSEDRSADTMTRQF